MSSGLQNDHFWSCILVPLCRASQKQEAATEATPQEQQGGEGDEHTIQREPQNAHGETSWAMHLAVSAHPPDERGNATRLGQAQESDATSLEPPVSCQC